MKEAIEENIRMLEIKSDWMEDQEDESEHQRWAKEELHQILKGLLAQYNLQEDKPLLQKGDLVTIKKDEEPIKHSEIVDLSY